MATRRPRIKPVANILSNSKRKTKSINDVKINKVDERDTNCVQGVENQINNAIQEEKCVDNILKGTKFMAECCVDTKANGDNLNRNNKNRNENNDVEADLQELDDKTKTKNENIKNNTIEIEKRLIIKAKELTSKNASEEVVDSIDTSDAFKCPKVGYQKTISHTSNSGIDDVFYTDIEENALQMVFEKPQSNTSSMSPSKILARQRIRPTPHFGQRRNSFVGSSPIPQTSGNEDNHSINTNMNNDSLQSSQTRRERHYSASFTGSTQPLASHHYYHHTPHKYLPAGITNSNMGRIRTESGCSVLSDTNTSTHKLRKTDDQRPNHRRDFEARFLNGVPEKNALKMSDLIYYNPATNPMEQKPNPSAKLEQSETEFKDVKKFTEEIKNDNDTLKKGEDVPVPQLKLNAKGELILDDKSLVIETTAEQEARKALANSSLIYLDEHTGMNGFYSRQKRTRQWLPSETIKFYRCLQNIGTDFSLMVSLFPNRTRRDLKLKFKKEERKNNLLISKALDHPKQFDIELLKQQLAEEEKSLDDKIKNDKKKCKKLGKISNVKSKADRVLIRGGVYQNESVPKTKRVRKININNEKSNDNETVKIAEITPDEIGNKLIQSKKTFSKKLNEDNKSLNIDHNNSMLHTNESDSDNQKLRGRTSNKMQKEEFINEGIIKIENKQESNQTSDSIELQDSKELQTDIDELLDSDAMDIQYGNTSYETSTPNVFAKTSQIGQHNNKINTNASTESHTTLQVYSNEPVADTDRYKHSSIVNYDDGSVNVFTNIKDDIVFVSSSIAPSSSNPNRSQSLASPAQTLKSPIESENNLLRSTSPELNINNDTSSSVISDRELSESDIQSILTELADGSLVLVSTLDPEDPDKVLNEIYMVDKDTGELCEEPLSIPDNIVQCILTVVS